MRQFPIFGAGLGDLGEEESSDGVFRTLRGQARWARWGRQQAGAQAAAPPPPGAAERPLMPAPRDGGSRLSRGLRRGRDGGLRRACWGGRGRGDEALPHPAPPRGCGGHRAAGPNPGQEGGARPSRVPQLLLPPPTPEPRPRASSYSASARRRRPERGWRGLRHPALRALTPPTAPRGPSPSRPPLWVCGGVCFYLGCAALCLTPKPLHGLLCFPAKVVLPGLSLTSYLCTVLTVLPPCQSLYL